MRCKTGAFRTARERLPSSLLQYAETDHAQRGRNADDLRHTHLFLLQQPEAEQADGDADEADAALACVGAQAQAEQHLQDHADAERLDDFHDPPHDLAGAELLEEDRRRQRQGEGRAQHAQHGHQTANGTRRLGTCEGGTVHAQAAGGHLSNGDEVGQVVGAHPAVAGHLIEDERDHRGAAKARETDAGKGEEQLHQRLKHVPSPPSRPARPQRPPGSARCC